MYPLLPCTTRFLAERHRAVLRGAEADDGRRGGVAFPPLAPRAADAEGLALFLRFGAHRGEFVLRQIAAIGLALREEFGCDFGVARRACELIHGLAVPIQVEPLQDRKSTRLNSSH